MRLFHVSEDDGIPQFDPRPSELHHEDVVWAISGASLHLYLAPRDCPRVCYRVGPQTTLTDRQRFFTPGGPTRIMAIETGWLTRVATTPLALYHMPPNAGWMLKDEAAGYWVSKRTIVPENLEILADLPAELATRGVELRVLPRLHALRDAVLGSSLVFNMIRMRNAAA